MQDFTNGLWYAVFIVRPGNTSTNYEMYFCIKSIHLHINISTINLNTHSTEYKSNYLKNDANYYFTTCREILCDKWNGYYSNGNIDTTCCRVRASTDCLLLKDLPIQFPTLWVIVQLSETPFMELGMVHILRLTECRYMDLFYLAEYIKSLCLT